MNSGRSPRHLLEQTFAAFESRRFEDVEKFGNEALARGAGNEHLHVMLAIAAEKMSQPELAQERYTRLLSNSPTCIPALVGLANLFANTGRKPEAISYYERALSAAPKDAACWSNLGLCYFEAAEFALAANCFEKACNLRPDNASFQLNLGVAYHQLGSIEPAVVKVQRAIELAPSERAYAKLAELMITMQRTAEASAYFRRASELAETPAGKHYQEARALALEGNKAEAKSLLKSALGADPRLDGAVELLASVLQDLGEFDEAAMVNRELIRRVPSRGAPYYAIVQAKRVGEDSRGFVEAMETLIKRPGIDPQDRCFFHYALGKSYDDLGEYSKAFDHFRIANDEAFIFRLSGRQLNRIAYWSAVNRVVEALSGKEIASEVDDVPGSERAILIVGMMRSGTTLVEQILSSHSSVAPGGELNFWEKNHQRAFENGSVQKEIVLQLGTEYLQILDGISPDAARVTDKMPVNSHYLGLIHWALPGAKIIHCRRNPIDTCLSIYFTPYQASPGFAHVPESIVFAYKEYQRIMAHWRETMPASCLLEIDYEDLVSDRRTIIADMLDFCGLDWEEDCMSHEKNMSPIKTSSVWQARQPVYTGSVERWRHYEPWLGAFAELLD